MDNNFERRETSSSRQQLQGRGGTLKVLRIVEQIGRIILATMEEVMKR